MKWLSFLGILFVMIVGVSANSKGADQVDADQIVDSTCELALLPSMTYQPVRSEIRTILDELDYKTFAVPAFTPSIPEGTLFLEYKVTVCEELSCWWAGESASASIVKLVNGEGVVLATKSGAGLETQVSRLPKCSVEIPKFF